MKAVVLAGGKGTRLAPYTKTLPKPLMPIGDMPILEILLRQMRVAGIDEVVMAVGHLSNMLESFFADGSRFGLSIRYSYEQDPLGTAGPLSLIEDLDESFLMMNGDVLTTMDFRDLMTTHRASGAMATIAMHPRKVKIDLGVLQRNGGNEIIGYVEKPTYDFQVSMGIYVFEPEVVSLIPDQEYFDFPDLVMKLIDRGDCVLGYPFDGYWQDLGRPDDYEQAVQDFDALKPQIFGEA
jgi:NDP-sugar pyrophosphorylase family protein